jgi:hypothetical protein
MAKKTQNSEPSKLDKLLAQLRRPGGASLAELMKVTGWQQHSVRGALAGTLKKKGHQITSEVTDGVRRYSVAAQ